MTTTRRVTAIGLVIHVLFPLAPPRLLPGQGIIDTLRLYGPNIYKADLRKSVTNQIAAMPSLHFGWALLVAFGFRVIKGNGPCNRQRIDHRRQAHDDGAWVREAAAAHAMKRQLVPA